MICSQCKKEFTPNGKQKICSKECVRQRKRLSNKKYNESEKGKEAVKKYHQSDAFKEVLKKYQQSDKYKVYLKSDAKKISGLSFYHSNKAKINPKKNIYTIKRRETDPLFKLTIAMRNRLGEFLRTNNMRKTNKTFVMVGCTPEFLKEYLEKKFKPGMTWKNHAVKGWHIDHRIPLSFAKTTKDLEKLMHYKNLQPMWATENLKKGDKY